MRVDRDLPRLLIPVVLAVFALSQVDRRGDLAMVLAAGCLTTLVLVAVTKLQPAKSLLALGLGVGWLALAGVAAVTYQVWWMVAVDVLVIIIILVAHWRLRLLAGLESTPPAEG